MKILNYLIIIFICINPSVKADSKQNLINELQKKVWGYVSSLETHTVETHVYRLRKKFSKTFSDADFIISNKKGYYIK